MHDFHRLGLHEDLTFIVREDFMSDFHHLKSSCLTFIVWVFMPDFHRLGLHELSSSGSCLTFIVWVFMPDFHRLGLHD